MAQINQLSAVDSVSIGDQIPVWVPSQGDTRRASVGDLLDLFQQQFAAPTVSVSTYTPATGASVGLPTPVSQQQWALLQPASGLAALTVVLPLNTLTADGTEVLITTTQAIAALTVSENGALAVYGAPSALSAGGFFRLRYVQSLNSWYRIG